MRRCGHQEGTQDFEVSPEEVFKDFIDSEPISIKEVVMAEAPKAQPDKEAFYAEEDSDNDSDFEVKYQQEEDKFDDLIAIKKPMFLRELMMSLESDNNKKFEIAIESAEELIRKETLNDLEVVAEDLFLQLCRIQNKFAIEEFSAKKYHAIQALVEK